jgi:hypothetical protein
LDAGVVITVEPGEDPEELYAKAFENTKKQIRKGLDATRGGF